MEPIDLLFYVTLYVSLFLSIFWLIPFFYSDRKRNRPKKEPVTIVVPAFNKAATIEQCLLSLVRQDYPLTIIVVDDGSTDGTERITRRLARQYPNMKYIRKKNGGKASALNAGLRAARTPFFGFIDADTYLTEDALPEMFSCFRPNVACVTAVIKANKPRNLVERIQKIEYVVASFTRKLLSVREALYYTPGFAVYRTDVIRDIGGFDEANITEDLEIGLRLKSLGYDIEHSMSSHVHTEVPSTLRDLFRQRIRWYRGHIYNSRKYSAMFFNRKFGDLGMLVLPFQYILLLLTSLLLIYELFDALNVASKFLADLVIVNFDVAYLLARSTFHPITYTTFFWIVFLAIFVIMLRISQQKAGERIQLSDYVLYILLYPFLNLALWLSAFVLELRKANRTW